MIIELKRASLIVVKDWVLIFSGDDLLLLEDDKVEAEMAGVHDHRKCDDCKYFMDMLFLKKTAWATL